MNAAEKLTTEQTRQMHAERMMSAIVDLQDTLSTFLYNLVHFCMLVRQEPVLSVFIYSD